MANKRIFIELIEKRNANGSLKKKKYFIKPLNTLYDTFAAMKLASSMEQINEEKGGVPIDEFEELFRFIVEQFDNQFTEEELMKGLPPGDEGFTTLSDLLMTIAQANQPSDTKAFLEEKKD